MQQIIGSRVGGILILVKHIIKFAVSPIIICNRFYLFKYDVGNASSTLTLPSKTERYQY